MKLRLLLSLLLISTLSFAQVSLQTASPKSVGASEAVLAKIDAHIEKFVNDGIVPGGSFLIAKNGKVFYEKNFGYRSEKKQVPYQSDDIYRIASMTKAITCVSIMQLWEQNKLDLDDPVHKYIPAYKDQVVLKKFNKADSSYTTVPVKQAVTIRNLLTHTSGIVYGSFNPGKLMAVYEKFDMNVGFSHETWSNEEWINRLAKVPLAHQPGARWSYGLNMDVLGRIIEVISGQPLNEYFKENIFDKTGMEDSHFYLPESKFDRLVPVYTSYESKLVTLDALGMASSGSYPKEGPRDVFAGGAGLSSTARDYAKFIQALVAGGGDLLGAKGLKEMTTDQMASILPDQRLNPFRADGTFALGFTLYQDKPTKTSPKSPGTYEWGGYFNTKFFIDPAEQLIFVGMTQIAPFQRNDFWDDLYKLVYESID